MVWNGQWQGVWPGQWQGGGEPSTGSEFVDFAGAASGASSAGATLRGVATVGGTSAGVGSAVGANGQQIQQPGGGGFAPIFEPLRLPRKKRFVAFGGVADGGSDASGLLRGAAAVGGGAARAATAVGTIERRSAVIVGARTVGNSTAIGTAAGLHRYARALADDDLMLLAA